MERKPFMNLAEKKKLCFFVFAYWHDARFKNKVGGPVKVYDLATNLTNRGHDVLLFIPKIGRPERQTSAGVCPVPFLDFSVLRFLSYHIVAFFWSLYLSRTGKRPDIIYVRIMWSFLPMLLGRLLSVPVVLEINDSPHRAYALIADPIKRTLVSWIDRVSFRLSDHILPVTDKIAENLHVLEKVPLDKMTVLPSGTDPDLFVPMEKSICCGKLGYDPKFLYIGFIGTFLKHQGVDTLIDAAPLVIDEYPHTRFLLVGDGPMRSAWEQKVRDMGLGTHFIFSGNFPYRDVPTRLGVMDVCVAPFTKEVVECSPVKIFDYLSSGKPVVAAEARELSAFFAPSGAVVMVESENPGSLAEGIVLLLGNRDLRLRMGQSGREFITGRYSRTQIAEQVETIALKAVTQLQRKGR